MLELASIFSVAITAFLDAALIPISVQAILVGTALVYPQWAWALVAIYAFASVLGSCVGYMLGRYGLATPIVRRFSSEKWQQAENYMHRYGPFVVAAGGTTPVPFPLFTIASGVFRVSLPALLLAVTIGRGTKATLFVLTSAYLSRSALEQFVKNHAALIIATAILLAATISWLSWHSYKQKRN